MTENLFVCDLEPSLDLSLSLLRLLVSRQQDDHWSVEEDKKYRQSGRMGGDILPSGQLVNGQALIQQSTIYLEKI